MKFVDLNDTVCMLITSHQKGEPVLYLGICDSHVTSAPMVLSQAQVAMLIPYLHQFIQTL